MDETDFEMHIPGMNFCGPGTNLTKRLKDDGITVQNNSKPVDRVDEAALRHDMCYAEHTDTRSRLKADEVMINEINEIDNPTCREQVERAIVILCLRVKRLVAIAFLRLISGCVS